MEVSAIYDEERVKVLVIAVTKRKKRSFHPKKGGGGAPTKFNNFLFQG
jgi:hypothetical protein